MRARGWSGWILWAAVAGLAPVAVLPAAPPTCTTHFFDWYVIDGKAALEQRQKQWTYRVDWGALGIRPEEIGTSVHYYEVQFRKIREAGFDGLHYEWHANNPKPQFLEALGKVGLPVAMFYDMEIRFSGRPNFMTPTEAFAKEFVGDVTSFYRSVPRPLWLRDRNGRLPIVVYGYAFDQRVTDPAPWHRFYRAILDGVDQALGERVVFHWTNNGSPQQMYGFQHFPEIQSYVFNEASPQTPVNARSATFVVHYDDLGVSFARQGDRASRWIRNDVRYLQEAFWLAKHTDPDLVFNYGWNELYEGEHLLPDAHWGSWRYDVASAMVRQIKAHAKADLPRVLIIADDFLPALHKADPATATLLRREMSLLAQLRSLAPLAVVALPGATRDWKDYAAVFALNMVKAPEEEALLASCGRPVVYASPDPKSDTPILRRFTTQPRKPLFRPDRGPANEYVVATAAIDVDLGRFPILQYRFRNSPDTLVHIRYYGRTGKGREVAAWHETSPTDDRQSGGQWMEGQANVAEIARHAAGEPILRLTRIEVILDDLEENGEFFADIEYLRLADGSGKVGWSADFRDWTVGASFGDQPGAATRYGFAPMEEDGRRFQRIRLKATVSDKVVPPVDEATRRIAPLDGVTVLVRAAVEGEAVPVLLQSDRTFLLNTYSPCDACWEKLIPGATGMRLNRGVLFRSFSHSVRKEGLVSQREEGLMAIQDEPLPIDRVRLVAPPEWDRPMAQTLPVDPRRPELRVLQGRRRSISFPDPGSRPPSVTLEPGEVVELIYPH